MKCAPTCLTCSPGAWGPGYSWLSPQELTQCQHNKETHKWAALHAGEGVEGEEVKWGIEQDNCEGLTLGWQGLLHLNLESRTLLISSKKMVQLWLSWGSCSGFVWGVLSGKVLQTTLQLTKCRASEQVIHAADRLAQGEMWLCYHQGGRKPSGLQLFRPSMCPFLSLTKLAEACFVPGTRTEREIRPFLPWRSTFSGEAGSVLQRHFPQGVSQRVAKSQRASSWKKTDHSAF